MANGRPHDHPLTDILVHGRLVYSAEIDSLIRQIVDLGGRDKIADRLLLEFDDLKHPDLPRLEAFLIEVRQRLSTRPAPDG